MAFDIKDLGLDGNLEPEAIWSVLDELLLPESSLEEEAALDWLLNVGRGARAGAAGRVADGRFVGSAHIRRDGESTNRLGQRSQSIVAAETTPVPRSLGGSTELHRDLPIESVTGLSDWASLMSFRPPRAVQIALRHRGHVFDWTVHHIETAWGDINLDYYPVSVMSLPGGFSNPQDFLRYIRLNINSFLDTRICEFHPYDGSIDGPLWSSTWATGAVIHIDMKALRGWLNLDDGSVVVSEFDPQHWIFSTCWTEGDLSHPVSGNRQFGFTDRPGGGWTYYTRGADRLTQLIDRAAASLAFSSTDSLWRSLQAGIANSVNGHGGHAVIETPYSARHAWVPVRATYWAPTTAWY